MYPMLSCAELFGPDGNVSVEPVVAPAIVNYFPTLVTPTINKQLDAKAYFELNRQPVYVNFGSGTILVDLSSFMYHDLAFSIRKITGDYIAVNHFANSKLLIRRVNVQAQPNVNYSAYLSHINRDDIVYQLPGILTIGDRTNNSVPVFVFGKNKPIIVCGCCGELLPDFSESVVRHVDKKNKIHDQWRSNKYTACHLCDFIADNTQDCVEHYFGHNHSTRMNRCITGVTEAAPNDFRLFKGYALPFLPTIQAQMAYYINKAPVAILMAIHRTTQIERANTQELPMALATELNCSPMDGVWIPDCPVCDSRYFLYNTVHYCSIAALQDISSYKQRICGHYLPQFTPEDMVHFEKITILGLIKSRLEKKRIFYGCAAYSTASRKDDFDDEDGYNDKYRYYLAKYGGIAKSTHAETSTNHRDYYILPGNNQLSRYKGCSYIFTNCGFMALTFPVAEDFVECLPPPVVEQLIVTECVAPQPERKLVTPAIDNKQLHVQILKKNKNAVFMPEIRDNVNHNISHLIRRWNNHHQRNKHKFGGIYFDNRHNLQKIFRGAFYYTGPVKWNCVSYNLADAPVMATYELRSYQTSLCVK